MLRAILLPLCALSALLTAPFASAEEPESNESGEAEYHEHVVAVFVGSAALLRVGGEYGFEVGAWEIAPQLDVDLVDGEESWVFGVTFGKGI